LDVSWNADARFYSVVITVIGGWKGKEAGISQPHKDVTGCCCCCCYYNLVALFIYWIQEMGMFVTEYFYEIL
jgi:hypothetical protein